MTKPISLIDEAAGIHKNKEDINEINSEPIDRKFIVKTE